MVKKKQAEYDNAKTVTSNILQNKQLGNFGNKLKSRITQHVTESIIKNNVMSSKEAADQVKRKSKKRISLRKKLKPVEEASIEES